MPFSDAQQPLSRHGLVGTFDAEHLRLAERRSALNRESHRVAVSFSFGR
jgi:hypothetical protein